MNVIFKITILILIFIIFYVFLKILLFKRNKVIIREYLDKTTELILFSENINKKLKFHKYNKVSYPIYYINLDKDIIRREQTEMQLQNISNNFYRIKGVNGKNIKNKFKDTIDGISFKNEYNGSSLAELGCILSHIKAINTAYKNGDKISLIVEDDIKIDLYKFSESLETIVSKAPNDWEVLQLFSGNLKLLKDPVITIKKVNFIKFHTDSWSCAAYLISKKGMEKILNILGYPYHIKKISKNFPLLGVSDWWIYSVLKTYTIYPYPFSINTFLESTIHKEHIERVHVPVVHTFLKNINVFHINSNNLIYVDKDSDMKFISFIFPNHFLTTDKNKAKIIVDNILSTKLDSIYSFPKIVIDRECSDDSNIKNASLVITTKKYPKNKMPFLYIPSYSISFAQYDISPESLIKIHLPKKKRFCAFINSNNDAKFKGITDSQNFYNLLQNMSENRVENLDSYLSNKELLSEYKFVIVFENEQIDGYISDKITNTMIAGTIPIYLGTNDVKNHFNKESFICVNDFSDWQSCINYILYLDVNENQYINMLSKPWLINNKLTEHFSWWKSDLGNFYNNLHKYINL